MARPLLCCLGHVSMMRRLLTILPLLLRANAVPLASPNVQGVPDFPDILHDILPGLLDPGSGPGSDSDSGIVPPILGYTLTWHDEFSSSSLSSSDSDSRHLPSSSVWLFDTGTSYSGGAPAWGNNELQSYTTSPRNIRITPQNTLQIIPLFSGGNNSTGAEGQWTSARIETRTTSFAAASGGKLYIESRLRTGCAPSSQQKGIWPAFWALGESFRKNPTNWPMASEWDIMEVINGEHTVYNTLHCGVDSNEGGPCNEYNGLGNGGVSWSGCDWHVVGFEVDRSGASLLGAGSGEGQGWQEETLTWFLDGEQVHRVSGADVGHEDVWRTIAHKGHFLLLNVAVGGNWPGYPDENTVDGEEVAMEVDYVRVWNADGVDLL
ncbi:glycoside hydrolase family 16 protein [Aspergillus foveolatus]|uniref:glycoside hydrolase family 16 protein n=1 Tax=Aspergillus foveolatus TaxID=210207 RepID=UPI003CCCD29D